MLRNRYQGMVVDLMHKGMNSTWIKIYYLQGLRKLPISLLKKVFNSVI
ncbi:hypothetical protein lpa_01352 [Legionella pneumophila 2300/99 Alcoy]|nr:hypothetical protein lpa_01352 [Legionella pneumophila 2300/99 Alcoy]